MTTRTATQRTTTKRPTYWILTTDRCCELKPYGVYESKAVALDAACKAELEGHRRVKLSRHRPRR